MGTLTASQGRPISAREVRFVAGLLQEHPEWSRRRLSQELCRIWDWYDAQGRMRDMACRTLLLKLHRRGDIALPAPRRTSNNDYRLWKFPEIAHDRDPIETSLHGLMPLSIVTVDGDAERRKLVRYLLHHHHYLGYRGSPGESMWYVVYDRYERLLACLTFGGTALKVKTRDTWIGWDAATRSRNLQLIANNQRFLILPWVHVYCLASHILSKISGRLSLDWIEKYGHPVHLLETFVDRSRFVGTCYQAANWILTGQTSGRTRDDRKHTIQAGRKDLYVYPLTRDFRRKLCNVDS